MDRWVFRSLSPPAPHSCCPEIGDALRGWSGTVYFAIVFASGFVLGTVRVLLIAPRLGQTAAVLLEAPFILTVSWAVCRRCIDRFGVKDEFSSKMAMGCVAFALLQCADLGVSVFLFNETPGAFFQAFSSTPGAIGLLAQVAFGLFPSLQRTGLRPG